MSNTLITNEIDDSKCMHALEDAIKQTNRCLFNWNEGVTRSSKLGPITHEEVKGLFLGQFKKFLRSYISNNNIVVNRFFSIHKPFVSVNPLNSQISNITFSYMTGYNSPIYEKVKSILQKLSYQSYWYVGEEVYKKENNTPQEEGLNISFSSIESIKF